MKDARLSLVRMGHLAWNSYEPSEGNLILDVFNNIMDQMSKAGIKEAT